MEPLEKLKIELKSANNLEEFLNICAKHYDFKNAKLGTIVKQQLTNGIGVIIRLSGAKPKK
jgi:hypothetical protein